MAVGILTEDDDEYADMVRADFTVIRELLDLAGAGPWDEPDLHVEDAAWFDMWGYSGLHTVRRLAVHLAADASLPEPLLESRDATDDPLLKKAYADLPGDPAGPFTHLIHHSDCEGYYVPVDFAQVIVDERLTGSYLGSSVRLLTETRRVAAALGLPEDLDPESDEVAEAADAGTSAGDGWQRYGIESFVCLRLIHAAKHSVQTGAAIAFC
ncbi:hypothetical protein GCM10027176_18340 [Actinoallomurus bryophytorum]|uniref:Uncharacterized protein n=2 Tax=Actinoallomurus bryophytorum TaxID=1490222 RepID=A0A543CLB1_9ACTN|nr:hypothetical protein FB559_3489 [Actinoallomurus bryophytorum]